MDGNTLTLNTQTPLIDDPEFLREIIGRFLQNVINEEFGKKIGAEHYQRSKERQGYRNGYYPRQIKTRVGSIELIIPRDREGNFRTELFERYQRSEKALVLTITEMYFRGISTRRVSKIVEELCGEGLSKSQVSELAKTLDNGLEKWRNRPLENNCAYLLLDALYHKVREEGRVSSIATFIAVAVNGDGSREILGCHNATSEYYTEWKGFIRDLKRRGMKVPKLVGSDDHDGLRRAIEEELTGSTWQRCQVHYSRNFAGKMGTKVKAEMVPLLKEVFEASGIEKAIERKNELIDQLEAKGLEVVARWIEETIDDTLNVFSLPEGHRKRMKSTNMLERLNEEVRRRTRVIRIFPNRDSCTRMVTAICQERSESWEGRVYLNFEGIE